MDSKPLSSSSSSHNSDPSSPVSSASSASSLHPVFSNKRLILCCDGTWQDSDGASTAHPTNVTRLSRCFTHLAGSSTQQIVYYQSGVGTSGSFLDRVGGGAFGTGIAEHIREAYAFLCTNWAPGDEIILIGFSRGAFTARSVAGMITTLGLLTVAGLQRFAEIFQDTQSLLHAPRSNPDGKPSIDDFPGRAKDYTLLEDMTVAYRAWLLDRKLTRTTWGDQPSYAGIHTGNKIIIKAVAVFDTVGSLGIPDVSLFHQLGLQSMHTGYQFWDTSLSPVIENSFHALALDETRTPFNPTIWEQEPVTNKTALSKNGPKPCLTKYNVRQMWFPGAHSDVGGGSEDAVGASIANMSLAWMLDQLSSVGCEFVYDTIHEYFAGKPTAQPVSLPLWGSGRINTKFYTGLSTRKPLQYTAGKLAAGKNVDRFLWETNECIHASVRMRLQLRGPGPNDSSEWKCRALAGWKLQLVPKEEGMLDAKDTLNLPVKDVQLLEARDMPKPTIEGYKWLGTDREVAGKLVGMRRWVWKYMGPEDLDNCIQVGGFSHVNKYMYEQPLGPFERYLLHVCGGVSLFRQVDTSRGPVVQPPAKRFDIWLTVKMKALRRLLYSKTLGGEKNAEKVEEVEIEVAAKSEIVAETEVATETDVKEEEKPEAVAETVKAESKDTTTISDSKTDDSKHTDIATVAEKVEEAKTVIVVHAADVKA